jgi:hypothetical protein
MSLAGALMARQVLGRASLAAAFGARDKAHSARFFFVGLRLLCRKIFAAA